MRDFTCPTCGQHLVFENSLCLSCGSLLGYSFEQATLLVVAELGDIAHHGSVDAREYPACANAGIAQCNWLVESGPVNTRAGRLCASCQLTRTRPDDTDVVGMREFAVAETAKRRLIAELKELRLPIVGRAVDPEFGLAFDLLSSANTAVSTGHEDGVITVDVAEGDDVHREQVRIALDEPYRTLLGHFRHETGHAYFHRLVGGWPSRRREFDDLFGDPDTDYPTARDRHYHDGPPQDWSERHVSSYASMHPAEDWAETFAHYLHIRDTLDTAAAFGLAPAGATFDSRHEGPGRFDTLIDMWLPLAWSLNMVNRSMGRPDLYPFVLPHLVLEKMRLVHTAIDDAADFGTAQIDPGARRAG
jgi:hypothetical protein